VTTTDGKKLIEGKSPYKINGKDVFIKLSDKISELAEKRNIKSPEFKSKNIIAGKDENLVLKDVRSDEHNELFSNKLCEVIKEKSSEINNTLYCSVSGGRKTMSVFMGFALSIYGRNKDKLYHILTSEANEKNRLFFYPTNKAQESEIELSEIPFVKLRGIIDNSENKKEYENLKYSEIVKLTQEKLDDAFVDYLIIKKSSGNIYYRNNKKDFCHLSPSQMKFYLNLLDKLKSKDSVPMIELSKSNSPNEIRNANSTISKINDQLLLILGKNGEETPLFREFKIKKMGSLKYDYNLAYSKENDTRILTDKKLNPGLAKYGIEADIKNMRII
jgi:CRISPR-associated protein (TIGR02584 family)